MLQIHSLNFQDGKLEPGIPGSEFTKTDEVSLEEILQDD